MTDPYPVGGSFKLRRSSVVRVCYKRYVFLFYYDNEVDLCVFNILSHCPHNVLDIIRPIIVKRSPNVVSWRLSTLAGRLAPGH